MLIDTHAHLDFSDFEPDLQEVLARAEAAGVQRIVTIGTSIASSRRAVELADRFPNVFAAIGVHPNAVAEESRRFIGPLKELARHPRVVAIGETGLDYHRLPRSTHGSLAVEAEAPDPAPNSAAKAVQAAAFEQQLDLAVELGLNIVIHERDAWNDTLHHLRPYAGKLRAVFHCFNRRIEDAHTILAAGHVLSFTGIVTFKNAVTVQHTVANVPTTSFMVETDAPYLAPVPHRGKRCEPAHTRITAECIANLRGVSFEQIARETTETAAEFFRFPRRQ